MYPGHFLTKLLVVVVTALGLKVLFLVLWFSMFPMVIIFMVSTKSVID